MKKITCLIAFSALSTVFPSFAGGIPNADAKYYGEGASDCKTWTVKRAKNDYFSMGQWMLGSISGAAAFGPPMRQGTSQEFASYLDNYCRENPQDKFSFAVAIMAIHYQKTAGEGQQGLTEAQVKLAEQKSVDEWHRQIADFKKFAKATDNINYDDPTLSAMWDKEVRRLAALPENGAKDGVWFLSEAHKSVKKIVSRK